MVYLAKIRFLRKYSTELRKFLGSDIVSPAMLTANWIKFTMF